MKLEKIPFYFSRGTLRLLSPPLLLTTRHSLTVGAVAAPAPQFANQLLGGFSHVFRHYIPGGRRRVGRAAFSDIGKDLATGTQRFAAHCFGPAPQEWADPAEEIAEKIAYPVTSLKVERSGVDGTDPRCGKYATCLT